MCGAHEKVYQELPLYAVLCMQYSVCGTLYVHACLCSEFLHSWAVLEDTGAVKCNEL
jgi:hypothetical protein